MMLLVGSQICQFYDVETSSDSSAIGMINVVPPNTGYVGPVDGEFSIWALVFCANIFSTAHIALEITGLSLFVLAGTWIFWATNTLEISGSGGYWVTGFIGIIFYNISFYTLRSIMWNSRNETDGRWHLSGINNGWFVYLITISASYLLVLIAVLMQKKLFDERILGAHDRSKAGVIILKIGVSIGFFFIFTSLIFAVYGRDYKIGLYFAVGGSAVLIVIFFAYLTAYLVNRRVPLEAGPMGDEEEDKIPLVQ
jgi:hypothetical protein